MLVCFLLNSEFFLDHLTLFSDLFIIYHFTLTCYYIQPNFFQSDSLPTLLHLTLDVLVGCLSRKFVWDVFMHFVMDAWLSFGVLDTS